MFVGWVISYSLNRLVKAVYICKTWWIFIRRITGMGGYP